MDDLASTLSQILGQSRGDESAQIGRRGSGAGRYGRRAGEQPAPDEQSIRYEPSFDEPRYEPGDSASNEQRDGIPPRADGPNEPRGEPHAVNQGMNPPGSGGQNPLGNLDLSALGSVLGSLGVGPGHPNSPSSRAPCRYRHGDADENSGRPLPPVQIR